MFIDESFALYTNEIQSYFTKLGFMSQTKIFMSQIFLSFMTQTTTML